MEEQCGEICLHFKTSQHLVLRYSRESRTVFRTGSIFVPKSTETDALAVVSLPSEVIVMREKD